MAMGERLRFFRKLRGMKLKELGLQLGFPEKSADVRMAQYESETRTSKAELTAALAHALDVSPLALTVPDIDSDLGLMHTLFALEDTYVQALVVDVGMEEGGQAVPSALHGLGVMGGVAHIGRGIRQGGQDGDGQAGGYVVLTGRGDAHLSQQ